MSAGIRTCVFRAVLATASFVVTGHCRGEDITAFIEPSQDIDVASPEMGTLAYVKVQEGDRVTAGEVVAGLDETVLDAARQMARTAMEARGRLRSAEAELQMQTERWRKLEGLRQRRHASAEEVARAEAQMQIAAAQLEAVRDELEIKTAEHRGINAQLDQKRIKAPIDGIVTHVYKDAGEFVSASDPVVMKIVRLDPLLAEFSVPVSQARKLQAGQEARLSVGSGKRPASGVVEFVSPTADAQSGTMRVKVRIPNPQGDFQCGDACWLSLP